MSINAKRLIGLVVLLTCLALPASGQATVQVLTFEGLQDRIGSIAAGKDADLVVVRGNPAADIHDIEKVETVFKDGVGYDSAKLLESVRGRYGQY